MRQTLCGFAIGVFLLGGAATAGAAPILGAVAVTSSSTFPGFPEINTINQSGLSAGYVSGVTDFDAYLATNPLHTQFATAEWFSQEGVTSATLIFDLGSVQTIDRIALWNEEFSGAPTFNVLASTAGVVFTPVASGLTTVDSPANTPYPAQVFNIGTTTGRYIRLDVSGCPQAGGQGHNGCGMGEIAFAAAAAAPEPATLFLISTAVTGLMVRRRYTRERE